MFETISCKACNEFGWHQVGEKAYILDQQFFTYVSLNKIVEGDNITLECVALKSYASSITWTKTNLIQG